MAIVVQNLELKDFDVMPGINAPSLAVDYGVGVALASDFPRPVLVFPDQVLSAAYFTFATGATGATLAVNVIIDHFSVTATSGNVIWNVQIASVAPAAQVLSKSLAATNTFTSSALATPGLQNRATVNLTGGQLDTIIASQTINIGYTVVVKVARDGLSASDTAVGDIKVRNISFTYQDT
jgi:hypothetical protein